MIIIVGDSWGVGEWDENSNLGGPGFGQYLMIYDQVINLSTPGGSNTGSIDRLENFLSKFRTDKQDVVYWIITDPSRCATIEFFLQSKSLLDAAKSLLHRIFDRANRLAKKYNIQIYLIGGCCDLDNIDTSNWSNLHIKIPSWTRLIDPECNSTLITEHWWVELGESIKKTRPDLLDEWLTISDDILSKYRIWDKNFKIDGSHPDRHGHQLLLNHLYPEYQVKP